MSEVYPEVPAGAAPAFALGAHTYTPMCAGHHPAMEPCPPATAVSPQPAGDWQGPLPELPPKWGGAHAAPQSPPAALAAELEETAARLRAEASKHDADGREQSALAYRVEAKGVSRSADLVRERLAPQWDDLAAGNERLRAALGRIATRVDSQLLAEVMASRQVIITAESQALLDMLREARAALEAPGGR